MTKTDNQKPKRWKWSVIVVGIILALIPDPVPGLDEALIAIVTYLVAKPAKSRPTEEEDK